MAIPLVDLLHVIHFGFQDVLENHVGGVDRLHSAPSSGRRRATLLPDEPERDSSDVEMRNGNLNPVRSSLKRKRIELSLFYSKIRLNYTK